MTASFRLSVLAAAAAALSCPSGVAQGGSPLGSDPFSTPVHGDRDGLWAARQAYKVSFDDGFTFYPFVGEAEGNVPVRWQTTAVRVGGTDVGGLPGSVARRVSDERVELRRGTWFEAYDVRRDGVEQTFVFDTPFAAYGELVIVGRVQTTLAAPPLAREHAELVFRDAVGRPFVRYGKAWAFDAAGRRVAVPTSWNGDEVRLHVSAEFVRDAFFPLTVDPLTSAATLETAATQVTDLDVARDPAGGPGSLMAVYSRAFAANDLDGYGRVADPDFTQSVVVFSDVSTARSTKKGTCAYVADARSWAAAFERELFAPTTSEILVYFHDRASVIFNSGRATSLSRPAGTTARNPDIGGRAAGGGQNAFVVYQRDTTTTQENTAHTEVFGALVDATTATEVSLTDLGWFPSGTTYDRECPTVPKMSEGSTTFWVVSWHELFVPSPIDDWDVNLSRVTHGGKKTAKLIRLGKSVHPYNKRFPQLDGHDGRYLLAYVFGASAGTTGEEIHTQRFYWPWFAGDPVVDPVQSLIADPGSPDFAFPRVAYDTNTRSHWAITFQRTTPGDLKVVRVGHSGGIVEAQTVFSSGFERGTATALDFSPEGGGSFPILYATDGAGAPLLGRHLAYSPAAQSLPYGTGCGGQISAPSAPYAGSEFFSVQLTNAMPNAITALGVSLGGANVSLAASGAPGCFLLVGTPVIWNPVVADPTGLASVGIPLPDGPTSTFDLRFQWAHISMGSNPLGVLTTTGLLTQVR